MAGQASTLGGPIRMADYLSIGLLSRLVPPDLVDQALHLHGRQSQRRRDLPSHAVAYYVMAMSLYRHVNMQEVLRIVTEGMDFLGDQAIRRNVGKSGISAARSRLGSEVMATLAAQCLQPQAKPTQTNAFSRDWRLVSLDGSTLEVADQPPTERSLVSRARSKDEPAIRRCVLPHFSSSVPNACLASRWAAIPIRSTV